MAVLEKKKGVLYIEGEEEKKKKKSERDEGKDGEGGTPPAILRRNTTQSSPWSSKDGLVRISQNLLDGNFYDAIKISFWAFF